MLTRQRSPAKEWLQRRRESSWSPRHRNKPGLTLIELVATIATIALLGLILYPTLSHAREQARTASCANILGGFSTWLGYYLNDHNGWIPGTNTSGVALSTKRWAMYDNPDVLHQSNLPVQTDDWMTPLARYEHTLPDVRGERLHYLWTQFRCPANQETSVLYPPEPSVNIPDYSDFLDYSWPACSYLMPACFQWWGRAHDGEVLAFDDVYPMFPVHARVVPALWEVGNENYVSRIDQVGPPARKVFVADGTRYLTPSGILDHDIHPIPAQLGSFTTTGAWWTGSTAYGVAVGSLNWDGAPVSYGSPSNGWNLPLTYRHSSAPGDLLALEDYQSSTALATGASPDTPHGSGMPDNTPTGAAQDNRGIIHAVFYDGHVEILTDRQSRDIDRWYPTGSIVEIPDEGMTTLPQDYVIP